MAFFALFVQSLLLVNIRVRVRVRVKVRKETKMWDEGCEKIGEKTTAVRRKQQT